MYLDTTFCSEQYISFPSRQEAEKKIWEQTANWVRRNGLYRNTRVKHVVLLELPARYGYERILQQIYNLSLRKWKVHVNIDKWNEYLCKTELSDCTSASSQPGGPAEWIHACTTPSNKKEKQNRPLLKSLPCKSGEYEVCQIKPCAMYFTKKKMDCLSSAGFDFPMSVTQGGNNYRVCYSCHSSLSELKTFVQHFAPKKITPCAIPSNSSKEEVKEILSSFLEDVEYSSGGLSPSPTAAAAPQFREFSPRPSTRESVWTEDSLAWINPSPEKNQQQSASQSQREQDPNPSTEARVSFDDTMDVDVSIGPGEESSDDEGSKEIPVIEIIPGIINEDMSTPGAEEPPSCTITPSLSQQDESMSTRRKNFARAKTYKAYCSMPLHQTPEMVVPERRRFSMPCNMKLPLIKVTPSSPSPDPNDPDYPEFFQDRLYLEHVSKKLDERIPPINESVVDSEPEEKPADAETPQDKFEEPELPVFKGTPRRIKRQQSMFQHSLEDEPDIFPSPPKRPKQSEMCDDDIFSPPRCPEPILPKEVECSARIRQRKRADFSSSRFKAELQRIQRKRPASDSDIEIVRLEQQTKKLRRGDSLTGKTSSGFALRHAYQNIMAQGDTTTGETERLKDAIRTEEFQDARSTKVLQDARSTEGLQDARRTEVLQDARSTEGLQDARSTEGLQDASRTKVDDDEDMFATSSPEPDYINLQQSQTMEEGDEPELDQLTPEIDDLIADAEAKNLPEHVRQRLRDVAECQKNVIQIE